MPGLLRGVARTAAVAGTATVVSNRVSRRQSQRWAAQEEPAPPPEQYADPPPPAQPAAGEGRIEKLKDLGDLRDQGVLTEEEFAAEKARILGG
jgi:hypothetical protein